MNTEHWQKLSETHQAELWPALSADERAALTAADPDLPRRLAPLLAAAIKPAMASAAPRAPEPKGPHVLVTGCWLFSILCLLGAGASLVSSDAVLAVSCFGGALFWAVLAVIVNAVTARKNS